jgi:hypothetical protein
VQDPEFGCVTEPLEISLSAAAAAASVDDDYSAGQHCYGVYDVLHEQFFSAAAAPE